MRSSREEVLKALEARLAALRQAQLNDLGPRDVAWIRHSLSEQREALMTGFRAMEAAWTPWGLARGAALYVRGYVQGACEAHNISHGQYAPVSEHLDDIYGVQGTTGRGGCSRRLDWRGCLARARRSSASTIKLLPALLLAELYASAEVALVARCAHTALPERAPESPGAWYLLQLRSAASFGLNDPAKCRRYGGLNHGVEHHLFPALPAWRYPEISMEVQAICEELQLPYRSVPGPWRLLPSRAVAGLKQRLEGGGAEIHG